MAADAWLLDSAATAEHITLRWYQWAAPTLSLGYFQNAVEIANDPRWHGLPSVSRLTGGGAILHDREWTYSCILPPQQTRVRHPYDLYDVIHLAIAEWFQQTISITLSLRGETQPATVEPTLCFLRQDQHDLCYAGTKILGSAQRRRKGALLQHGSLILETAARTPEIAGVCPLISDRKFLTQRASLAHAVAKVLGEPVHHTGWTDDERATIDARCESGLRHS
jgi:lipoyl(octanoyl) transferase